MRTSTTRFLLISKWVLLREMSTDCCRSHPGGNLTTVRVDPRLVVTIEHSIQRASRDTAPSRAFAISQPMMACLRCAPQRYPPN